MDESWGKVDGSVLVDRGCFISRSSDKGCLVRRSIDKKGFDMGLLNP